MRAWLLVSAALLLAGCSLPKASDFSPAQKGGLSFQELDGPARPVSDGSLWTDRPLYADLRARRLNDLFTIRISDSTSATVKGDLNTNRTGANSVKGTGLLNKINPLLPDGVASTTATATQFKGTGQTDRSIAFTSTITARVVRVLNNGNLVFEGFRDVQLNNEIQRLYIAGMVDPALIDANNSVPSNQVAELRMAYGGKGVVDETTKPGYVSRLLNLTWPY